MKRNILRLHLKDAIVDEEATIQHIVALYWIRWAEAFKNAANKYYEENQVAPYQSNRPTSGTSIP